MENKEYVHGYSNRETQRLYDQADTLASVIHDDTLFPKGSLVLEAGCGVGAQTKIMATQNPETNFMSIDISDVSIAEAKLMAKQLGLRNVQFEQADLYNLPFADETFDSIVLCFVLEHLGNPAQVLRELKRVLKKGGKMVAIEGDHGSLFFYPDSKAAHQAIDCQVQLQGLNGGNPNIGRELYSLFQSAGLQNTFISPKLIYIDANRNDCVGQFINTFALMIEEVGDRAILEGIIDKPTFDKGVNDLYRTAEIDGVFSYTLFKGYGQKN